MISSAYEYSSTERLSIDLAVRIKPSPSRMGERYGGKNRAD